MSGTTVVVNLDEDRMWSDGQHVDAADVVFWMNLLKTVADGGDGGAYSPGYFPDNVSNVVATGTYQVTFTTTKAFSPSWFLDNELSQITPLPLAWDITKKGAAAGSGGCSSAVYQSIVVKSTPTQPIVPVSPSATACFAVYNFLANSKTGQAADPATYATNPLWAVVDGPWKLASYSVRTGNLGFQANAAYDGPQKPYYEFFDEVAFVSDVAELVSLESGKGPDVGYVATQDVPANPGSPVTPGPNVPQLKGRYDLDLDWNYQINYFPLNRKNPTLGPVFSQQYVRAAMQSLIDEPQEVKLYDNGYGVPTNGPVPTIPPTYATPQELQPSYPYDLGLATSLLQDHGWTVVPGGTSYCSKAGSGAGECGTGIDAGTRLAFPFLVTTGSASVTEQMRSVAVAWEKVGITARMKSEPFPDVIGTAGYPCIAVAPSQVHATCSAWDAAAWGGGWIFTPDFLPTGELLFDGLPGCHDAQQVAGSNAGSYCDATNHANIEATTFDGSPSALYRYEDYLARQLPVLWQPLIPALAEVSTSVAGVAPFNVYGAINPEYWRPAGD